MIIAIVASHSRDFPWSTSIFIGLSAGFLAPVARDLQAKLQQDKSIGGVVTLGAQVAKVAEDAIAGANSSAKLATFDLNADVAKAVEDGKILFAVDQQPYLQGYLAVVMLTQYKSNLNVLGGDWNEYANVALTVMLVETMLDIDQRLEEIADALARRTDPSSGGD